MCIGWFLTCQYHGEPAWQTLEYTTTHSTRDGSVEDKTRTGTYSDFRVQKEIKLIKVHFYYWFRLT